MNTQINLPRQRIGRYLEEKGKVVGVVVAESTGENHFRIGFSVTHPNDKFKKQRGIDIAVARIKSGSNAVIHPARTEVIAAVDKFRQTAARYFTSKSEMAQGRNK